VAREKNYKKREPTIFFLITRGKIYSAAVVKRVSFPAVIVLRCNFVHVRCIKVQGSWLL